MNGRSQNELIKIEEFVQPEHWYNIPPVIRSTTERLVFVAQTLARKNDALEHEMLKLNKKLT